MNDNSSGQQETNNLRQRFGRDRLLQLMQSEGLRRRGLKTECPARCAPAGEGAAFEPSCSVFEGEHGEGAWKCHRCNAGGDVFTLAQTLTRNSSFPDAVRWAQERDGARLPPLRGRPAGVPPVPAAQLFAELAEDDSMVRTYLRTRGLEAVLDRGLVRCSVGQSKYGWLNKKAAAGYRLAMALWSSSGALHSFQVRSVDPNGDPKKTKLNLLGVEFPADKLVLGAAAEAKTAEAKTAARVYLAEGMADTLALQLAGVVAIGAPGVENVPHLQHHLGDVAGRELVLCPQNDRVHTPRASRKCETAFAALQLELRAAGATVRILATPPEHKDPAAWLQAVGLEPFMRAVHEDLASDELVGLDDAGDESDEDDDPTDVEFEEEPTAAAGDSALPDPAPLASVVRLRVRFQLTDTGNAERLVYEHGDRLRFCHTWGAWLVWDGRRWQRDATSEVMRLAKSTIRGMKQEFDQEAARRQKNPLLQRPDEYLGALGDFARKCESADKRRAMVSMACVEAPISIEADQLDCDPWSLNVQNGVIDLRTGVLRPHRREDLATRYVPIDYDPTATCARWELFLQEIFPMPVPDPADRPREPGDDDEEVEDLLAETAIEPLRGDADLIAFMQRAVGYSLTGETSEQKFFLCHGTGSNGKSVFFNVLELLLGEYAMVADFDTFAAADAAPGAPRPDIVRLRGARLVTAAEPDRRIKLSESRLKLITGEDTVVARSLNEREQAFRPILKLWLMANHKPDVAESNHGFWRRVQMVPFKHTIPEDRCDPHLKARLRAELPGILRWAVEGCIAWQKQRLGKPSAITEATQEYRHEMDVVGQFLEDCCFLHANAKVKNEAIYKSFISWCAREGEKVWSQKAFTKRLVERSFKRTRTAESRGWKGIGLLSDVKPIQENLLPGNDS